MTTKMRRADHAEDQVRLWVSAAGFLVNSSQRDRAGWDHLIDLSEARQSHPNDNFLGIPSRTLSARVQVKSAITLRRKVRIKLSNLQRAIEDPLPWLFLIVRYAKDTLDPIEVAGIHLDKKMIESILEHVHSMRPEDLRTLHRKSFPIAWAEADILRPPFEQALRSAIDAMVPSDLLSYASAKKTWADMAGLPAEPIGKVTFSVVGSTQDELLQRVSRAAIGLEDTIPIKNLQYTRERFGAMRPDPKIPRADEAKIGLLRSDADCGWKLSVLDHAGSRSLELPVFFRFSGAVIPGLPEKYWLSRIETSFLDIVATHAANTLSLTLKLPQHDELVSIADLSNSLALAAALSSATQTSTRVCLSKNACSLELNLSAQSFELGEDIRGLSGDAGELAALMRELQVPVDTCVSIRSILALGPVARFVRAARQRSRVPIKLEWPAERLDLPLGPAAAIIEAPLPIAETFYIELVLAKGEVIESTAAGAAHLLFLSNDLSSLGSYRYPISDRDKFPFQELADATERELRTQGISTVICHRL